MSLIALSIWDERALEKVGQRSGKLEVVGLAPPKGKTPQFLVQCDCGNRGAISRASFKSVQSCGCSSTAVDQCPRHGRFLDRCDRECEAWWDEILAEKQARRIPSDGFGRTVWLLCLFAVIRVHLAGSKDSYCLARSRSDSQATVVAAPRPARAPLSWRIRVRTELQYEGEGRFPYKSNGTYVDWVEGHAFEPEALPMPWYDRRLDPRPYVRRDEWKPEKDDRRAEVVRKLEGQDS